MRDVSDSVVMQIKILMDIPEHIWSAIDNRDLVLAAQLFIVAQHINYSLMFEVGHSMLTRKYPIISKQWSIVSHFRSVIIGECNSTLRSLDLSMQVHSLFCLIEFYSIQHCLYVTFFLLMELSLVYYQHNFLCCITISCKMLSFG